MTLPEEHNASLPPVQAARQARDNAARELLRDFSMYLFDERLLHLDATLREDVIARYLKAADRG